MVESSPEPATVLDHVPAITTGDLAAVVVAADPGALRLGVRALVSRALLRLSFLCFLDTAEVLISCFCELCIRQLRENE